MTAPPLIVILVSAALKPFVYAYRTAVMYPAISNQHYNIYIYI